LAFALWLIVPLLALLGFWLGRQRARQVATEGGAALHSLPNHYGQLVLIWAAAPPLALLVLWLLLGSALIEGWTELQLGASGVLEAGADPHRVMLEVQSRDLRAGDPMPTAAHGFVVEHLARTRVLFGGVLAGLVAVLGAAGLGLARRRIAPTLQARNQVEAVLGGVLQACSVVAVLTTVGIVLSLLFEAVRFFQIISPLEFFFSTEWSPQTALRPDQVGSSGAFGAIPVFAGTLLITAIAMAISIPIGLMAAINLAFYASDSTRAWVKPMLEVIAGIPTVVWGSFAALTLGPWVRRLGESLGLDVASESALAAGLVMGVMIIPFVSSLSDDALNAVPSSLRDASLAIGATLSETIRRVMVPAALPGIVGAFLLAVSRAIGETMIVVMAAGLAANLTANPFEAVTTVTVQVVTLLVGDQEFDSAKTLAAFALGLTLFFVTLVLNLVALMTVRRFREEYE